MRATRKMTRACRRGPRHDADGHDDVGMLALDARGQVREALAVQRLAGERRRSRARRPGLRLSRGRPETSTDSMIVPSGRLGVLCVRRRRRRRAGVGRRPRHAQGEDEEEQ